MASSAIVQNAVRKTEFGGYLSKEEPMSRRLDQTDLPMARANAGLELKQSIELAEMCHSWSGKLAGRRQLISRDRG